MVRWVFKTYPEASKPTSDAEMVVLHAILEINRCERVEVEPAKEYS
jgi:hypothetical protein